VKLEDKILLVIELKQGSNKPYSTNNGTYLTKSGADKRRISQEELQRLFQASNRLHADEIPVIGSKIDEIDNGILFAYYKKEYGDDIDKQEIDKSRILENLYLSIDGNLTLAGLLLFGKNPEVKKPLFNIKAVSFVGTDLSGTSYRDSEDIKGNIPKLYKDGISFLTRNLHKRQNGKNFNSEGDLEIPKIVLEELLVNAIIHRDYFIDAPINLFIFDDRIEIISPGKLPNSISVENIKLGISVIRNPIITSFASKLLPYRGIGSGIVRALKNYSNIDFVNDKNLERFKVTIHRKIDE
jgi:predicted HTH transcriptional regulator